MYNKRIRCHMVWAAVMVAVLSFFLPRVALAVTNTEVANEAELRAAVGRGGEAGNIKLGRDIRLSQTLDIGNCSVSGSDGNVTIDLAGHELGYYTDENQSVLLVPAGYTLTLRDSGGRNAGSVTGAAHGVMNYGTFTLTSGGLRNNGGPVDGCGLYNDKNGVTTITGGIIELNSSEEGYAGGGIYNEGTLQLSGGMVQNNLTDQRVEYQGRGGGIFNGPGGNFTLSGGTIQNNQAAYGGGVYNDPACEAFVVMGRAKLQGNVAVVDGGGIYNGKAGDSVKLAILGGVITQNTAGGNGGGIANLGTMAASAGNVTKNTAGGKGGGIYDEGSLTLSGTPVVKDNTNGAGLVNDCHLVRGVRLTIEDALTARASVGIVCEDSHQVFTTGYDLHNNVADAGTYFFANPNGRQQDVRIMDATGDDLGELRCVIVIHYLDENGSEQECVEYADVSSDSWGSWNQETWFVVREDTTINDNIGVRGNVNLILCADKTLRTEYIAVRRNDDSDKTRAVFTVYNSTGKSGDGFGYLVADGSDSSSAGIGYKANSGGVGSIVINGGHITAYGGDDAAGIGGVENRGNGPITINGGYVEAVGGKWGAGIGGGQGGDQDNAIYINGGEVRATGGKYAAGIGGGDSDSGGADGGKVVIRNATVYARGGSRGAGIGGGEDGEGGNVTIENSTVNAYGGGKGPGIGGGQDSDWGGTLTVYSGTVYAEGGTEAAGIGGGEDSCGGSFVAKGGTIIAAAGDNCATAIGAGHGDYHEGSKELYAEAMVHAGSSPTAGDYRIMGANERVAACGWHYVRIEPCDHQNATTYADKDHMVHTTSLSCSYCMLSVGAHDEAHSFDAGSHSCVCGHVEDPIVLKRDDATDIETVYVSRGASYTLRSVRPQDSDKFFAGWKVTGLAGTSDGTVLPAGSLIAVNPASDQGPITLVAQWADVHQHGFTYHPARAATCTEDGNVEYWLCDQATGGYTACGGYFVRADEGETSTADVEYEGATVGLIEVDQAKTVIAGLGHEWGEWGQVKPPTCEEPGIAQRTCIREGCSATETQGIAPIGHVWGEASYAWSADNSACTATNTCTREGCGFTQTETATKDNKQLQSWTHEATCTKTKQTLWYATFKRDGFETQSKRTLDGLPLGHDWGAPTYAWSADSATCTATRVCTRDASHQETETVETSWTSLGATCTKEGGITYTASFENEAFAQQSKTVSQREPRAHGWGEPTYAWADAEGGGKTCTATRVCAYDANHVETETVTAKELIIKAPTCAEPGERAWRATFSNAAFATQLTTAAVPATGHDWGAWETVQVATDSESGLERRTCKNDPTHVEERVVPVTGHVHHLTKVEAKEPTCTTDGHIEHWVCDGAGGCGSCFSDKDGVQQIFEDGIVPPEKRATGHAWLAPAYTWTADNGSVVAIRRCARNPLHIQRETGRVTAITVLKATCTTGGVVQRIATFQNAAFLSQAKTVRTDPLGHEWGAWVLTKRPTQSEEGIETRTCTLCGESETRPVPKTTHKHQLTRVDAVPPTCTEAGSIEHWVCSGGSEPCARLFADAAGTQELSKEEIARPAFAHDWGKTTYT